MKNDNAKILIEQQRKVLQVVNDFITVMGVEAKKHFDDSFENQGFTDDKIEKWEPRKNNRESDRAILIKTGDLRRSIKVVDQDAKSVTIGSDLEYAQVHNEGTKNTPKRQFMGYSKALAQKLYKMLDAQIRQIFK
jgi:phage gpG-like protein